MTLLTLFTAPKPFVDERTARIQINALRCWQRLPDAETLVLGKGEGIESAAREVGARYIPNVRRNRYGTPLISSMIELARLQGKGQLLCIINTDILVTSDLPAAARSVDAQLGGYVLLGRRWDLEVEQSLEFTAGWERRLREAAQGRGQLHRPSGSDYFVFPREMYQEVPDFAVGRAGWDNWMIFHARQCGQAVVDCTNDVVVVHQNHDYRHLPGGSPHYSMPESDENIHLAGGSAPIRYTILDATHALRRGRVVRPSISRGRLLRTTELVIRRLLFFLPAPMIENLARPKRWRKHLERLLGQTRRGGSAPDA